MRTVSKAGARRHPATSRRIRVLWLIKGLGRGGAEMLVLAAAELRDRDTFECEVGYLLESRSWLAEAIRETGVPVNLFASAGNRDLRWASRLRRFLRDHPVDIVHVHSPSVAGVARLVARSLPSRIRPTVISTEHLPWSGHGLPTRLINATTFPLDGAHIAVSNAVEASIPPFLRRSVTVLNHGIPVERIRASRVHRGQVRAELGISGDEVLVGTVANLTAQKGYDVLLEAASRLAASGHSIRFAIAGRGPLEGEVGALRDRLGLGDRFQILGPLEDAPRFMAGCDIFCLSSHYEGLPLVVMEAMALGLPVVATKVGGIPELVEDGTDGLLIPAGRADLLAEAIQTLAHDPELRTRLGLAASEHAQRFDNRSAVLAIEKLYLRVARARRNGDEASEAN